MAYAQRGMFSPYQALLSEFAIALAGLTGEQTQLRPAGHPEKWTIQQIVRHMQMAFDQTAESLNDRVAKGRPTLSRPTFGQRVGQFAVTTLGLFPAGRPAPRAVVPPQELPAQTGAELTTAVSESLGHLQRSSLAAAELFGRRRCLTHQALGPLSVSQWGRFHLVHGRHHVKQILAIRAAYGI